MSTKFEVITMLNIKVSFLCAVTLCWLRDHPK